MISSNTFRLDSEPELIFPVISLGAELTRTNFVHLCSRPLHPFSKNLIFFGGPFWFLEPPPPPTTSKSVYHSIAQDEQGAGNKVYWPEMNLPRYMTKINVKKKRLKGLWRINIFYFLFFYIKKLCSLCNPG